MTKEEFLRVFPHSIRSKADAFRYALELTATMTDGQFELNFGFAKNVYRFFCDNVDLPDVSDSGCCGECPTITHPLPMDKHIFDSISVAQKKAIEDYEKALKGTSGVETTAQNYDDVAEELFGEEKESWCIVHTNALFDIPDKSVRCTSYKQTQKVIAINCLLNVAKYLNGDWKPDWNDSMDTKYYLSLDKWCETSKPTIMVHHALLECGSFVYFKTEELAQRAIDILGSDTIRLALSTDY